MNYIYLKKVKIIFPVVGLASMQNMTCKGLVLILVIASISKSFYFVKGFHCTDFFDIYAGLQGQGIRCKILSKKSPFFATLKI